MKTHKNKGSLHIQRNVHAVSLDMFVIQIQWFN